MASAPATAKINLALVVGPRRADGKHEVATVLQRLDLADQISIEPAPTLSTTGFPADTLVIAALERIAELAGGAFGASATIEKRIPVAAGLGGGSSDAATALRLANALLASPVAVSELERIAAGLGADVPFFLRQGPQLGTGDGSKLSALELPQDYWVVLWLPDREAKESTAVVYASFDGRRGEVGFESRRNELLSALRDVRLPEDLGGLPHNDLVSSPLAGSLRDLGAFRADVTGAGPAVYGLFLERREAAAAATALRPRGRTWVCAPCWYG